MTKSRVNNTNVVKRKQNPLAKRAMKSKMNNIHFNGQIGNFRSVRSAVVTASNQNSVWFWLNTESSASAMGSIGSSIANLYSEFVYESITFRWLPSIAPGSTDAGSQIYIGYLDNPEIMNGYVADTVANNVSQVKSLKNAKFFNAWENFTYSVPISRRRKTFDVNTTITHGVDVDDRSSQGMVVSVMESISAAATLGRWVIDSQVKLMNLNTFTT